MALLLLAAGLLLSAVSQAAAAPLFSVASAAPMLGMLFLGAVALYRPGTAAMVMVPLLAIAEAWSRGAEPGLVLLAYLPLVPLLDLSSGGSLFAAAPGVRYAAAVAFTGAWARSLAAAAAIAGGASASAVDVLLMLILPGLVLDLVLTSLVYGALRLALGEPGRSRWLAWR